MLYGGTKVSKPLSTINLGKKLSPKMTWWVGKLKRNMPGADNFLTARLLKYAILITFSLGTFFLFSSRQGSRVPTRPAQLARLPFSVHPTSKLTLPRSVQEWEHPSQLPSFIKELDIEIEAANIGLPSYIVLPIWSGSALLDYFLHRRTDIEHSSSLRELRLHYLMMLEVGLPVLMILLDINTLAMLLMFAAYISHTATVYWDTLTAVKAQREVGLTEQHIHSFMEVLPLMVFSLIVILYRDEIQALLNKAAHKHQWTLRWKRRRPSARYLAGIISAVGLFIVLPYSEELQRCLKASTQAQKSPNIVGDLNVG